MINFSIDDNSIFLGIGLHAFDRLGLEKSLPNFRIVSLRRDPSIDAFGTENVKITALSDITTKSLEQIKSTRDILSSKEFEKIVTNLQIKSDKIYLLPYKSTPKIEQKAEDLNLTLLSNPFGLRKTIENKANFRDIFSDTASVPKYQIYTKKDLSIDIGAYDKIIEQFNPFVLQDDILSGGMGTFIIKERKDFDDAMSLLARKGGKNVVASEMISGRDVSIQACVTKYGTFYGPLQEQIIDDPLLTNVNIPIREKFCGGRWGYLDVSETTMEKTGKIAESLGNRLKEMGYKGIFGIDLIMTANEELYVIEINPRLTGLTSVISMIQRKNTEGTLLLMHILELADIQYTIDDIPELKNILCKTEKMTYAVSHNTKSTAVTSNKNLKSGVYTAQGDSFVYSHPGYDIRHLRENNQILITSLPATDEIIHPSGRLARILTPSVDFSNAARFVESLFTAHA